MAKMVLTTALTLVVAACGTPKPVLETAKTTAANVSLVNSSLEAFKENNRASAERRRQYILPVAELALAMEADTRRELSAKKIVEDKKDREAGKTTSAFAEALIAHLDATAEQERQAEARSQALSAAMAQSYTAIGVPSDQLKTLAKALSDLAEQPSRKEQLDFLRSFFTEAYKLYKESEEAAKGTTGEADATASTAGASTAASGN
jgi:hypothetical protein